VSKSPPKTVTYSGGSDGVVMYLSSGATEFLHGVPVEVSAEDAKSLAGNPDFQPAPRATTPTTQPSEEVSP
tara:strand:- start:159 stop:371 length:213 start_codon:yes stop_codon:yes gene_type:complete